MTPKQQIAQLTAQLESRDAAIAELKAEIEDLSEGIAVYRAYYNYNRPTRGYAQRCPIIEWEARRSKRAEKGCGA